jgi:isopropylmalate/homocitrate/citramalate synthase
MSQREDVLIHEMSLRDGMHPKRHQITLDQMVSIATALDEAGCRSSRSRTATGSAARA